MNNRVLAIIVSFSTLISGCLSNSQKSEFSFAQFNAEQGNVVSFQIEMNDSTATYDVYLYMRYNYHYDQSKLPATITVTSPSGLKGSETLQLEGNLANIKKYIAEQEEQGAQLVMQLSESSEYYDTKALYRSNIRPVEYGLWKIELYIPNIENVIGAGIETITIPEKEQ